MNVAASETPIEGASNEPAARKEALFQRKKNDGVDDSGAMIRVINCWLKTPGKRGDGVEQESIGRCKVYCCHSGICRQMQGTVSLYGFPCGAIRIADFYIFC